MKTFNKQVLLTILFIAGCYSLQANNLQISSDVTLTGQNTTDKSVYVTFDISWDNSWRDTCNWDAVWVFLKFSNNNAWKHAYLSTDKTEYSVGTDNGIVPAFSVGTTTVSSTVRGIGVFIYRDAEDAGSINWQSVKLKWYYGENGLTDAQAANASIKVFATEMVYIPKQSFYLGGGNSTNSSFLTGYYSSSSVTVTSYFYLLSSESSLLLNGTRTTAHLYSAAYQDNYNLTINASYPKGYAAFYCMKYEITQEQYVEFINSLQPGQQTYRISATAAKMYMSSVNTNTSPLYRNGIRCKTAPTTSSAGVWGCDLNNNDVFNEADDGQNIACNYISWSDALAYADWAGLRPMTEMEFEKSSKGPEQTSYQYAWGTTNYISAQKISSPGEVDEASGTVGANVVYGSYADVQGPMRVGCFATSTSDRESAGASYYGVMDLSGNLWEQAVPVLYSSSVVSGFDGSNGDGELFSNGSTDVTGWLSNVASGMRGGAWNVTSYYYIQSGNRTYAQTETSTRYEYNGFRCVRTAQ